MPDADPVILELAALIRGALVIADRLEFHDVGIRLDAALNDLIAHDASCTVQPVPFTLNDPRKGLP